MWKCSDLNISSAIIYAKAIFPCIDIELRVTFYYRDLSKRYKPEKVI